MFPRALPQPLMLNLRSDSIVNVLPCPLIQPTTALDNAVDVDIEAIKHLPRIVTPVR